MSEQEHDRGALASHVLNTLQEQDLAAVETHMADCEQCRQERAELADTARILDEIPPEAFMEGPPDGGELLLQRTFRQVRAESNAVRLRRAAVAGVAAVVLLAGVGIGGALIGRQSSTASLAAAASASESPQPQGTVVGSNTDPVTGARMTVRVVPADGWVRVTAAVNNIPQGQPCQLWVVATDGTRYLAGGWLVSAKGAAEGTTLNGSALVAANQVGSIEVDNTSGQHFVTVPV